MFIKCLTRFSSSSSCSFPPCVSLSNWPSLTGEFNVQVEIQGNWTLQPVLFRWLGVWFHQCLWAKTQPQNLYSASARECEFFILFMYFILFYFIFLYWFWQQWCKTANKLQRTVGVTPHVPHPAPIPLEYTGVEVILQSILEHACPCFALSNFRRRVWEREGENNVAACDSVCTDSSLPPLLPVKYPQILLAAAAVIFIPVFLWASTIW